MNLEMEKEQDLVEGADRKMDLGDLSCLDFFGAAKDLPMIFQKEGYWLLAIWLAEYALGMSAGEAIAAVRDMPVTLMHQTPAMEEAAGKYESVRETLPDCRAQWKQMGVDFDAQWADLCKTCPFSEEGGHDCEREYSVLMAIARMPLEKARKYLNGKGMFASVENMDASALFCHVLERPFVYPISKLVYDILCEAQDEVLDEVREIANGEKKDFEKSKFYAEAAGRLLTVMHGLGIKIPEELFQRGFASFLKDHLFGTKPCDDDILGLLSVDAWEDDEEENEPFGDGTWQEENIEPEENDFPMEAEDKGNRDFGEGSVNDEEGAHDLSAKEGEAKERLDDYPYFRRKGKHTAGAWFARGEKVPSLSVHKRRYVVPFHKAGQEDLIEHLEISAACCDGMFDASPGSQIPEDVRRKELDFLCDKVRLDGFAAAEVAWCPEREEYLLLVWNAASRRMDYVKLIDKSEGRLLPIPYQIIQFLKSEKRRIICYQPYLLCGILSLYGQETELKTIRSLYNRYRILHAPGKRAGTTRSEVFGAYEPGLDAKERFWLSACREKYGEDSFLALMPFYGKVLEMQERYAAAIGMTASLGSQSAKDLMYGYSYLRCGLFPAMQNAAFVMCDNGHLSFEPFSPGICYVPGYVMEYRFVRGGEEEGASEVAIRDNRRARQALLKEVASMRAAFYHGDLKVLYADDFRVTFYASRKCRSVHATDVSRILMHETYRYGISSNKLLASFWGVSMSEIRKIERH